MPAFAGGLGLAEGELLDNDTIHNSSTVWARPRPLSVLRVFNSESGLRGDFVWARRALNSPKRRFPARAVQPGGEPLRPLARRRPGQSRALQIQAGDRLF
jgi:hypothetical protein